MAATLLKILLSVMIKELYYCILYACFGSTLVEISKLFVHLFETTLYGVARFEFTSDCEDWGVLCGKL